VCLKIGIIHGISHVTRIINQICKFCYYSSCKFFLKKYSLSCKKFWTWASQVHGHTHRGQGQGDV